MSSLLDLTDQTFGHLKVIERAPSHNTLVRWHCICMKCGGNHEATTFGLRRGQTIQCADCQGLFKWDDEKDQTVQDMKAEGKSEKEIAAVLGCNPVTVHRRVAKLGILAKRTRKTLRLDPDESQFRKYMNTPCTRKCLECGKTFSASGRLNRLCFTCGPMAHGAAFV
ncbi:hypothetical protein [Komagataeibacter sp. FNDCF1]|uniref:hypothetical protein n=1 Tax=Komagataeibacter sp. FNDCF1 TaxID=2878681 RepID=UPI001E5F92FA|nr:hypothetical protein [Komagataeibacter sp. FNDCF1]MCE2563355.1 hypothetical protein [Komagataeibacter sp. FNDCF1]